MSLLKLLEPEELIGRYWDRWARHSASMVSYEHAAINFEDVKTSLSVFYRGLGGEVGIQLVAGKKRVSGHRLSFRQRLGFIEEALDRPTLDGETIIFPTQIDYFSDPQLNRTLYFWLAGYFAHSNYGTDYNVKSRGNPYAEDLEFLKSAFQIQIRTLEECSGLRAFHTTLCRQLLLSRVQRRLPEAEQRVEDIICTMLGGENPTSEIEAAMKENPTLKKYKSFLPVPLWGNILNTQSTHFREDDDGSVNAKNSAEDEQKRAAERRALDQTERDDAFIINRFDKMLSFSEMVNLNRANDDDDDDDAKSVADEMDVITVSSHKKRVSSKLKLDLDLPPNAINEQSLKAKLTYPEWNYKKKTYYQDHCSVIVQKAPQEGEDWEPNSEQKRRIQRIRRQFEALRAKRQILRSQPDGAELDMDALVRAQADIKAYGHGSNRIYTQVRNNDRDLSALLLVDVSLSTDSWINGVRVLDVEKEALSAFSLGLTACGDDHAIYSFTSRKKSFVRLEEIKGFDEKNSDTVTRRIAALKPGFYTRMGAAIRHAASELEKRPNKYRLLLVLTDGKPSDVDHYEGRYGFEDTRRAIQEARRSGITVFGITVDDKAREYFPHLFGRGAYHIVGNISLLPSALPKIYSQLTR